MPFGLVNAPSSFQRLMEDVLRGLQWAESLLYMDDIITPGPTVKESLRRLENVFKRLMKANLKLKPSKCIFFQKSVKFLGHVVSEEGVHTCPDKIEAVRDWPTPVDAKQVRSFLGLASYYRKFVRGFADIARPLHKICEKKAKFLWSEECETAFKTLKQALTQAPILAYPRCDGGKFILDTDASDKAVGAVLSQEQDGKELVIAYMSKTMNIHEQSYCVTRKELLAVVSALRNFHSYLYGQEILLRTDNSAVSWMRSLKTPTGQMARWLQEVSTYNLIVTHRPGQKHGNADALSRRPCQACLRQQKLNDAEDNDTCESNVSDDPKLNLNVSATTRNQAQQQAKQELSNGHCLLDGWDPTAIAQEQLDDPNIQAIFVAKRDNKPRPEWSQVSGGSASLKTLWRQWDRLEMYAGMLYRRWVESDPRDSLLQLIVPSSKRLQVLRLSHDIPSAGHLGTGKTLDKVRQSFYWPALSEDVKQFIKSCDSCTARKLSRKKNKAPLGQYLVGEPMERVALDILGPLPLSKSGNRYILVIADCFTKWTESVAIPNQEAKTVAEAFVNHFVCRFGVPLQLHSDQGKCFESKLFHEMCSILDIDKTRTTSMRPQSNGTVERFNRTLISMLTMYCNENQDNWDTYLPQVMMAYRSSTHASTHVSPNRMVFGREITLPLQAIIGRPALEMTESNVETYVQKLQEKLIEAHSFGRK
ncbi:MAG: RNase H-like domain-containing protein, partial [Candidatus Thiodiazotropha endolucinida]|nr:DDE-type integrase/transposase/recombinase [Candidatus Thiodiazotropha taylori]MCW4262724.1 RNase H-like domain-containing protein [Candidatus Thiodiazotropha endolucinida]